MIIKESISLAIQHVILIWPTKSAISNTNTPGCIMSDWSLSPTKLLPDISRGLTAKLTFIQMLQPGLFTRPVLYLI